MALELYVISVGQWLQDRALVRQAPTVLAPSGALFGAVCQIKGFFAPDAMGKIMFFPSYINIVFLLHRAIYCRLNE